MDAFALLRRGLTFSSGAPAAKRAAAAKPSRTSSLDFFQDEAEHVAAEKEAKATRDAAGENGSSSKPRPAMSNEHVDKLRREAKIAIKGNDVPAPLAEFAEMKDLGVAAALTDAVRKQYNRPTPIQMQAIPALLERRDLLGVAPTGSGKTLAYVLPVVNLLAAAPKSGKIRACILAPTRELAQQIKREADVLCEVAKIHARLLSQATSAAAAGGKPAKLPHCDLLVSTPMRLVSALKLGQVSLGNVEWLIIDEADRLFDNGYERQLDEIISACANKTRTLAMFSATMPDRVEHLAQTVLHDYIRITVGAMHAAASTVKQELMFVGSEEGKMLAFRQLLQKGLKPPVLIFVQSRLRAQELFDELVYERINVDVIHADCTTQQRDLAVKHFREGRVWVLICTDLMGRGVDFKGVNMVINYDFPPNPTEYIHRVGRTGRAGHEGHAITFFTTEDGPMLRNIANVIRNSGGEVPDWMLELKPIKLGKERHRIVSRKPISADPKLQKQAIIHEKLKEKRKREAKEAKADKTDEEDSTPLQPRTVLLDEEDDVPPLQSGKTKKHTAAAAAAAAGSSRSTTGGAAKRSVADRHKAKAKALTAKKLKKKKH